MGVCAIESDWGVLSRVHCSSFVEGIGRRLSDGRRKGREPVGEA